MKLFGDIKISTHFRAAFTAALVVFIGYMLKQQQIVAWLQLHWLYSDLITGVGMAYGVYTTYSQPLQPATPPTE